MHVYRELIFLRGGGGWGGGGGGHFIQFPVLDNGLVHSGSQPLFQQEKNTWSGIITHLY